MTPPKPSFLLDEHIPLAVAVGLRRLGIDARHVSEEGLNGQPDSVILNEAARQGRIVVTRDYRDFLGLVAYRRESEIPAPSVLLVPSSLSERDPGALVRALKRWAEQSGSEPGLLTAAYEWLGSRRDEEKGGRVREPGPSYTRALRRLEADRPMSTVIVP